MTWHEEWTVISNSIWLHTFQPKERPSSELYQLSIVGGAPLWEHDKWAGLLSLGLVLNLNDILNNLLSFLFGTCSIKEDTAVAGVRA